MKNPYGLNLAQYSTHNVVLKQIGSAQVVLDVGCNDGYLGVSTGAPRRFYGLDYRVESIEIAKRHYADAAVFDLNKQQPIPWKIKFDAIVFADVLEHVFDPVKVLSDIVRGSLSADGNAIVSVPNIANWLVRLRLLLGIFDYTDSGIMDRTHLHLYTFKSAQQLVADAGLAVTNIEGGANIFGPIIKLLPFLRGLLSTNIVITAGNKK